MACTIRTLTPADADLYRAVRREMLVETPWAFGSSLGEDRFETVDAVRTWLETAEGSIVAAVDERPDGPRLVGAAGVMREGRFKRRHIASIWGVYVRPDARGRGLGRSVVAGAIDVARGWPGVAVVQLSVSESSVAAKGLYESLGFVAWGVEPDCLRIDGRGIAEIHMTLRL